MKDFRNLPAEVIARLDAATLDAQSTRRAGAHVEQRLRRVTSSTHDETASFAGYATIYDFPYDVAGGIESGGWSETIARGACTKSLAENADVRCLVNHEGIPIARTKSGTMELIDDDIGLRVEVPALDLRSSVANDVAIALERGDLDEMSFAFRVIRQEWNGEYTERIITELQLFDVSIVTYPANPATVVGLRNDEPAVAPEIVTFDLSMARAVAQSIRARG